jgi:hypothetical protein
METRCWCYCSINYSVAMCGDVHPRTNAFASPRVAHADRVAYRICTNKSSCSCNGATEEACTTTALLLLLHSQHQLPALPLPLLAWWGRCLPEDVAIPARLCSLSPERAPRPAMSASLYVVPQQLRACTPQRCCHDLRACQRDSAVSHLITLQHARQCRAAEAPARSFQERLAKAYLKPFIFPTLHNAGCLARDQLRS